MPGAITGHRSVMQYSLDQIRSPFQRLRALLGSTPPGLPPIDLTIGEPKHGMPAFAADIIAREAAGFSRYPPIGGLPELRGAIAAWMSRRYPRLTGVVDADRHILPLAGSREGLFSLIFPALARISVQHPAVLMPNPFYQAYLAAALAAQCEPVLLPAGAETGFLPDLDAIPRETLARTITFYLATPANPQGAVASAEYLAKAIALARSHGFMLVVDECYAEIYRDTPPAGVLETAHATGSFSHVLSLNSLSKRSNAPGLRSGFIAGDADFLAAYLAFRNVACPQIPLPIQHASAALWTDEAHVETSRELYRKKLAMAAECLSAHQLTRLKLDLPEGGFFLWLDLAEFGGGEAAAETIWKECGVKILPGGYLAQPDGQGINPGSSYARVALVESLDATEQALSRVARLLR
jgi:aspartate/methionine/tyrosine aminotransferase